MFILIPLATFIKSCIFLFKFAGGFQVWLAAPRPTAGHFRRLGLHLLAGIGDVSEKRDDSTDGRRL